MSREPVSRPSNIYEDFNYTSIFKLLPKPLITNDQLRLLKYDNILSGKYKSNDDFEFNCSSRFEDEVNKYSYMWKNEGEYSKKRVN